MRLGTAALLFVLSCNAAGEAVPELIRQIEQAALAEGSFSRIDTLFRSAELLGAGYEPQRIRLVRSGLETMGSLADPEMRGYVAAGAASLLAEIDQDEALRLAREAPLRQSREWRDEYRGRAFSLIAKQAPREEKRAIIMEGLQSGAFHISGIEPFVDEEIFAGLMRNFPRQLPAVEDAALLLRAAERMAWMDVTLALGAVDILVNANWQDHGPCQLQYGALRWDFEGRPKEAVMLGAALLVRTMAPERMSQWITAFRPIENRLPQITLVARGIETMNIVTLPRQVEEREGVEAITLLDRLRRQAEIGIASGRLSQGGTAAGAGIEMDRLMQRYCRCQGPECASFATQWNCGEAAQDALRMLRAARVRIDDLQVRDATLRSRWLVLALADAIDDTL